MVQDIVFLEPLDIMLVVVEEDLKVIQAHQDFHLLQQEVKEEVVGVDMVVQDLPQLQQINLLEIMQK